MWHLPRNFLRGLIWLYQKTLSPDHSWLRHFFSNGCCRFHPTCSEYGKLALKKYGVMRAIPKIVWRILRCNPWSGGGIDKP
ncbi:membrane protein insertion efficiency factor YidD [Patescibacteria group bacterium]|nr:membrane protein insertion efficiency factor YidD [Patescibacteria group bacterium]